MDGMIETCAGTRFFFSFFFFFFFNFIFEEYRKAMRCNAMRCDGM